MSISMTDLLRSHDLIKNPFTEEEAQNDTVFEELINESSYTFNHQAWDRFFGDPPGRGTSILFGIKGSGKTAIRRAMEKNIEHHNAHHEDRILLIRYTDFNDFLDIFRRKANNGRNRRGEPGLADYGLAQHLDAILSCGVDALLAELERDPHLLEYLPSYQKQDLDLLLALYLRGSPDQYGRIIGAYKPRLAVRYSLGARLSAWMHRAGNAVLTLGMTPLLGYIFYRRVARAVDQEILVRERQQRDSYIAIHNLPQDYLRNLNLDQPHWRDDEDIRRQFMGRFIELCRSMGFQQVVIIMDKVDEPSLINGVKARMEEFVWPLWNNRILQLDPNLSFKMLLPSQLYESVRKATGDKANQARFDKQKVIYPFRWSNHQLYDMMSDRLRICRSNRHVPYLLNNLFDDSIEKDKVLAILEKLRQPRFVLNYLYRLLAEACANQEYVAGEPVRVNREVFYRVTANIEEDIKEYYQNLGENPD